jgi:hypothetical protein
VEFTLVQQQYFNAQTEDEGKDNSISGLLSLIYIPEKRYGNRRKGGDKGSAIKNRSRRKLKNRRRYSIFK